MAVSRHRSLESGPSLPAGGEGVLGELDGATALLRVFDRPATQADLIASLASLHHLVVADDLRCVEIVNANLGKLQDWFNNTFAQTSASITNQVLANRWSPPCFRAYTLFLCRTQYVGAAAVRSCCK